MGLTGQISSGRQGEDAVVISTLSMPTIPSYTPPLVTDRMTPLHVSHAANSLSFVFAIRKLTILGGPTDSLILEVPLVCRA
jgi:hypothetical protein